LVKEQQKEVMLAPVEMPHHHAEGREEREGADNF